MSEPPLVDVMATKKQATREVSAPVMPAKEALPFEAVMERLEGLVGRLEEGELSLEESLAAYEAGIGLVREAQSRLDAMDARLEQLTRDGRVVPLEADSTERHERRPGVDPTTLKQPPPADDGEFDDDTNF